ncbi:membrane-spanning 4-domains subfamily A member 4D-like [Labrus mixtus]|uniref:membrane-spanning 4-domains subfamily A member 4D-like n=1 Tax=Labrus mixtus TaxID=508554 RepID=UPI0029BFD640|nr:membrane-spanning 4-domains subfamily A member 4D-like [Labrus mixtus]XP_060905935.1 membrane-spanning 4-domains subfamily A member 4D-like [Labrus mixtus]
MSLTKTKADGVTVLTLTSDPQSLCPPFCQILKSRCYSPPCCDLSKHLKRVQGTSQSLLGALQIMIGLLNIGLGAILTGNAPSWQKFNYLFPFWLGGMFIFFGAMCILSEKCPRPWLVILTVILNLSGVGFAIAAIILYSIYMVVVDVRWLCEADNYEYDLDHTATPLEKIMTEKCYEAEMMVMDLWRSIFTFLIMLSVLEFCIVISSAVLGIKALKFTNKGENKSPDDSEHYRQLQEADVTRNPTV